MNLSLLSDPLLHCDRDVTSNAGIVFVFYRGTTQFLSRNLFFDQAPQGAIRE
jgi:hypothetical protein